LTNHLRIGGKKNPAPDEYLFLLLCRDVYHCLPSELANEDWGEIADHIAMMQVEWAERKRKRR
jgi:hypothetical protein